MNLHAIVSAGKINVFDGDRLVVTMTGDLHVASLIVAIATNSPEIKMLSICKHCYGLIQGVGNYCTPTCKILNEAERI